MGPVQKARGMGWPPVMRAIFSRNSGYGATSRLTLRGLSPSNPVSLSVM